MSKMRHPSQRRPSGEEDPAIRERRDGSPSIGAGKASDKGNDGQRLAAAIDTLDQTVIGGGIAPERARRENDRRPAAPARRASR